MDAWEPYHVDDDRSECRNAAAQHPEKLREFVDASFEEAEARTAMELLTIERAQAEPPRNRYLYYPGSSAVPEGLQ